MAMFVAKIMRSYVSRLLAGLKVTIKENWLPFSMKGSKIRRVVAATLITSFAMSDHDLRRTLDE